MLKNKNWLSQKIKNFSPLQGLFKPPSYIFYYKNVKKPVSLH